MVEVSRCCRSGNLSGFLFSCDDPSSELAVVKEPATASGKTGFMPQAPGQTLPASNVGMA